MGTFGKFDLSEILKAERESKQAPAAETALRLHRDSETQKDSEDSERLRRKQKDSEGSPQTDVCAPASLLGLPFKQFIAKAAEVSIEAASSNTRDVWQSETWEFTRLCKTHPKLMSLSADEAWEAIPWVMCPDFDEEAQMTFIYEWKKVHCLPGVSPLDWAADMAQQRPLYSTRKQFKAFNEFVSLAGWLQVLAGNSPIFLPTRKTAQLLKLKSNKTIATMCGWAVDDGLMEIVERHTRRRATRYRFRTERYDILSERFE